MHTIPPESNPQNRAVQEDILTCAFPSVARPTGFPALRFPPWPVKCEAYFTGPRQFRMEPRADLQQRSNAPLNLDLPRTLSGNPR